MIPLRDELPFRSKPYLTVSLIAVNILVFLYQMSLGLDGMRTFVAGLGAIPAVITGQPGVSIVQPVPAYLTMITSMFLHGGLMHLGGNMLFLWIFGNNVEDVMGRGRFLIFYLVCGVAAALGHIILQPASQVPMVGASGAISGVLGAYLIMFPRSRIVTLLFFFFVIQVVKVPALFFLGFWIILQFISGTLSLGMQGQGGVAWFAHVGGFLAGVTLVFPFRREERLRWYRQFS
jgi:membrane associated rhomboid family serine protease